MNDLFEVTKALDNYSNMITMLPGMYFNFTNDR
jgi:hypothetical protein